MKQNKKLISIITFLVLAVSVYGAKKAEIENISYDEQKDTYTCTYKDLKRTFILCLPENCNEQTSLILMLHGLGRSAASFKSDSQMEIEANERNYAVVYLDGSVDPKNKSHGKGWHYHNDEFSKNDVMFIVELAKYCQKTYGLGPRVFAVGFSNGGFMVNRLASCGFDKNFTNAGKGGYQFFTGVASVSGIMTKDAWDAKKADKPIGYLQINGTLDDVVPMEFMNTAKNTINISMEKTMEYYCSLNNVSKNYKKSPVSEVSEYYDFGSKVGWVIITEGRHNWPTMQFAKIDACKIILDFFDAL